MGQDRWQAVDDYIVERLTPSDPVFDQALHANAAAGLPPHDVSPAQGKFLQLVARMIQARRILEIGTLGGVSTIWLARALRDGDLVVTLEADADHAAVAAGNIARAGLSHRVDLRIGPALETLPALAGEAPFDLVFIDADKPNNPAYLAWALRLTRRGSVIIGDNVVRDGAVTDPASDDPRVRGVRAFFDQLAADSRVSATALQTVGSKGWDGFVFALVE